MMPESWALMDIRLTDVLGHRNIRDIQAQSKSHVRTWTEGGPSASHRERPWEQPSLPGLPDSRVVRK